MLKIYENRSKDDNNDKKKDNNGSDERIHLAVFGEVRNDKLDLLSSIIDFLLRQSCFDVLEEDFHGAARPRKSRCLP